MWGTLTIGTFYRVQERQWWTGPPAFPETVSWSVDQLWFWDQFEWASIANLVVQRLFGKTIWQLLNCIENSWFEAFVKMGYMGLHGLDFSGFFQPCARVFGMGFPHWDPLVFQPLTINCWIICGQTHHFRNHTSPTKTSDFCPKAAQWSLSLIFFLGHPNKHEQVSLCSGNWYGFVWNSNGVPIKFPWIIIPLLREWLFLGIPSRRIVYFMEHPYMDDWGVPPF